MSKATDTSPLRAELERAGASDEARTVYQFLERQKPEIARALPDSIGVERFTRTVLTEIRRSPKLLECAPESLLGAMMLAAQLGLEPGPLGLVYLVPFKQAVEFIVGYRGFVELAYRSGHVKDLTAGLVRDGDSFHYRYGTRPELEHIPLGPAEDRDIEAAYAVARLKTGGAVFVVTYAEDWERARKASAAGSKNLGPWKDDRPAMIRKTAVRRLEPWLPKTTAIARALEVDETAGELEPEAGQLLGGPSDA